MDVPFDEERACRSVSEEFPDICTCQCNDNEDTLAPTRSPSLRPTFSPTLKPTTSSTFPPTPPSVAPVLRCGCDKCTEDGWNTIVDGHSCGNRINFVKDSDEETLVSVGITTGPYDEAGACRFVSDQFPDSCTCVCDSGNEDDITTSAPTLPPTQPPTFPDGSIGINCNNVYRVKKSKC